MRFINVFLSLSIVVLGINAIAATITPSDRYKTDLTTSWTSNTPQTYTVGASASGCSFNTDATSTTGGAELTTNTSNSAAAEKVITHTEYPTTTDFSFSVHGVLDGGPGPGSALTWSATLQQKFFWLTPTAQIVKAGTDVTVTANGAPTESTWTVNSSPWKVNNNPAEASSITLNSSLWTAMGWNPDPIPTGFDPPTAGQYTIAATTTETSPDTPRSATANVYAVEITCPAKDGNSAKWLSSAYRYDCQAVKSSITGSYNLSIAGNWASRADGQWSLSAAKGTIASATSSSTTYSPPSTSGSVDLRLKFTATGDDILDTRTITIFEDHLARDYFNFDTNRSCDTGWKPLAQYGVAENDIPAMSTWNCFGSVVHAYNNTGTGFNPSADSAISGRTLIRTLNKPAGEEFDAANTGTIQRGDVIFYEAYVLPPTVSKVHAQTVMTGTTTYGANNEKPTTTVTWKWATCAAGEWTNGSYKQYEVDIKVYR